MRTNLIRLQNILPLPQICFKGSTTLNDMSPDKFVGNLVTPSEIQKVIKTLNKNSARVLGDIPLKIISMFSNEVSGPT